MVAHLTRFGWVILVAWLMAAPALAQRRPHIGYVYPAGGQQATTVAVKLGGQDLDDVHGAIVTGGGVTARVVEYYRRLNNQEIQLLNEQLRTLKRQGGEADAEKEALIARIERRTREWVQTPACASIASLAMLEVTIAPEAEAGARELRLVTPRGVSNPLAFHVGELREHARKPMLTSTISILGKEAQALRKRPAQEAEARVELPCVLNGQIASGEVNRYRFEARKGQRLTFSVQGRQLIPFIADAVPGWFQPVIELRDAQGREVAFADDERFRPDPVIRYEVPKDGEYVLSIHDAIYRGREDFVYRVTAGELPFVTGVFPLGGKAGEALPPELLGWNVRDAQAAGGGGYDQPGRRELFASVMGYASNRVPFALDTMTNELEREPNGDAASAQRVTPPVVINGRIGRPGDRDVFEFSGKAKARIVVDVSARRLESPLDATIKITDAAGRLLAFNDDREDMVAGLNTHAADPYLAFTLPSDGVYRVHVADTAAQGGAEYGYRLRIGPPQPDFELRAVPSSVAVPINGTVAVTVYAARRDGFTGPIRLTLKNPPAGITAAPAILPANQNVGRIAVKGGPTPMTEPVRLTIVGEVKIDGREIVREAMPAEDRMQAFLWRQLAPAADLPALVFNPREQPAPRRMVPERQPAPALAPGVEPPKPKFTKQQIAGRLRQLKLLYEEGLLTDAFYGEKVAECDTPAQ